MLSNIAAEASSNASAIGVARLREPRGRPAGLPDALLLPAPSRIPQREQLSFQALRLGIRLLLLRLASRLYLFRLINTGNLQALVLSRCSGGAPRSPMMQ